MQRHNSIRDTTARELRELDTPNVLVEQTAPRDPSEALRPDISYHDHEGRPMHLDVEVVTMHRNRNFSSLIPGALIEHEETVKKRKYSHLRLLPCVMSHLGRLGKGCQAFVKSACRGIDERERSCKIAAMYQSISCALQKGNVAILAASGSLMEPMAHQI